MLERQKQEAGDNSQQFQDSTVINIHGIDEKRAREIVDEKIRDTMITYTQEAYAVAEKRMQLFANDLIPKLVSENLLDELKDPSILRLLSEAQKTAASTERPNDYSLLSELLIHRVKKGFDRNIRAGISRAVKIVDEITDDALLGLTVAHSLSYFVSLSGNISYGINKLNDLFSKILCSSLPKDSSWLDHLDVLDAIRINPVGSMKKLHEFYPARYPGYTDVGIKKGSENYEKAQELLFQANLPNNILCDHELSKNYVRLPIMNKNQLDLVTLGYNKEITIDGLSKLEFVNIGLDDDQKQSIIEVYNLYDNDQNLRNENFLEFIHLWDEYENLKILHEWWDNIPIAFTLTAVGRVLAHANAQRCDPTLPSLD